MCVDGDVYVFASGNALGHALNKAGSASVSPLENKSSLRSRMHCSADSEVQKLNSLLFLFPSRCRSHRLLHRLPCRRDFLFFYFRQPWALSPRHYSMVTFDIASR